MMIGGKISAIVDKLGNMGVFLFLGVIVILTGFNQILSTGVIVIPLCISLWEAIVIFNVAILYVNLGTLTTKFLNIVIEMFIIFH